jgi:cytochrome c-type biogenesis protein CcmH
VKAKLLLLAVLWLAAPWAQAGEAAPAVADPVLEKRVMALAHELRCLVCQNQTIADSNADLAVDLRNEVREMMRRGSSDREIVDYMTSRYGDFVLYRPPVKAATLVLWFGPLLLLVLGLWWLVMRLRERNAEPPAPLTDEERRRAAALLADTEGSAR